MELKTAKKKINECKLKFTEMTFFLPNYIKMNLATRQILSECISEEGEIDGMKIQIDYELEDGEVCIGMGQGPTTSKLKIF